MDKKLRRDEPSELFACFIDETLIKIDTIENAFFKFNNYKKHKKMAHEEKSDNTLRLAFDIAKLALKVATVAAAFCAVKEIHNVHKAIERRREEKK